MVIRMGYFSLFNLVFLNIPMSKTNVLYKDILILQQMLGHSNVNIGDFNSFCMGSFGTPCIAKPSRGVFLRQKSSLTINFII